MSRWSKGWGCCGPTWSFSSTISIRDEDDEEPPASPPQQADTLTRLMQYDDNRNSSSPSMTTPHQQTCHQIISSNIHDQDSESPTSMNLAAALAAERQYRENNMRRESTSRNMGTPERVSLMRLLEESRGEKEEEEVGNDRVCCVCMGRKKGAAFIPCGHTFCRVCSREVWFNRGSCPLCNRSILEILDIF